jgi:tripartite-type tricarboxylate transporter receptor subunit TctC
MIPRYRERCHGLEMSRFATDYVIGRPPCPWIMTAQNGKQVQMMLRCRRVDEAGRPLEEDMNLPRRRFLRMAAGAAALPADSRMARAQAYPTRPIRLVVPFPPGGAFDAVGRPWADKMKPLLGTVVVENIGGGGSSLGAAAVARARPDGYTILLGGTQTHVNEALLKSRPLYDPVKDLDPIASVAAYFLGIAVHPAVPIQTLKEFIAYAKANPSKLSYGHSGVGTIQHLTGELFKSLVGTPEIVQVPYRGTGPAIADLISGQVPVGIVGVTGQVLEFHRSGKMRVLAVTSPRRLIAAPELPTAAELGLHGMTVTGSIGLLAPAGTPIGSIEQIAQATRTALAEPAYQQMLIDAGMESTLDSNPEKFRRSLAADVALWTPVVKALGLKID